MTEQPHTFGSAADDADDVTTPSSVKRVEVNDDTVLADLLMEASVQVEDVKWYPVPNRPNISLGFSTTIDYDTLRMWFKKATDRKKKELKTLTLAAIIMSNQSKGIKVKGNVVSQDGEELILSDERLWSVFNTNSVQQCLKAIYVSDGHILSAMQEVIEDAGYGDVDVEADDEDPLGMP